MKICSSCGYTTENDEMKFCTRCGSPMNPMSEVPEKISLSDNSNAKRSKRKIIMISAVSVCAAAAITAAVSGITIFEKKADDADMAVPASETTVPSTAAETEVFTSSVISDVQLTAATEAETITAPPVTTAAETYTYDDYWYDYSDTYDTSDYSYLKNISTYNGYSFYDVFTDVEAVFDLFCEYDPYSFNYETYKDCYNYRFSFYDYNENEIYLEFDKFDGGNYNELPLTEVKPYLKSNFTPTLKTNYYYSDILGYGLYLYGNTAGNYSNFSGLTDGYTSGLLNEDIYDSEIIYCGGSDYSDWVVKAAVSDGTKSYTVINDHADMVMYYSGYIYYRKTDEDCRLYRINNDGTNKIRLTDTRCSNARIYNNMIYYCENKKFYSMDMDGNNKTLIIDSNCYLPNFYNDCMYCISSDGYSILKYDLYSGALLDKIYLADKEMHIDNFFIEDNILVAKGYYTDNSQTVAVVCNADNIYDYQLFNMNVAAINAFDNYIYMNYEYNGSEYILKVPLCDYTNKDAFWTYEMPDMINSYFYIVEHTEESSHLGKYIYQNDLDGKLHRYDLP